MRTLKCQTRLFVFLVVLITSSFADAREKVIGYYTYRSATSGMTVDEIPGELLTHVIYAFIEISDEGKCQVEAGDALNEKGEPSVLSKFGLLRKKYPKLILMMAVGGWGGSGRFSEIASTEASRSVFVKSCIELVKRYALDGVDLDWEYPVTGGLASDTRSPGDAKNFVLLVADLRKELNLLPGGKKVLSAAVSGYGQAPILLDVAGMTQHVDWLGLMAYDFFGASSDITGHHAALFDSPSSRMSGKTSVDSYLAQGAKPERLVLGIPFYAHSWAKVQPRNDGLSQKFKGVPETRLGEGAMSYAEVQRDYMPKAVRHFDSDAKVPWLFDPTRRIMVSYEDDESIKFKAEYVRKAGLGGIMIWELNHDGKQHELLKALAD
jgi:chitinase